MTKTYYIILHSASYVLLYLSSWGQPIDSLERVFHSAPNDSIRLRRMIDASAKFRFESPIYCLELATRTRLLASKLNRKAELAQAENLLGMINEQQGDYRSALAHYLRTYDLIIELKKPQFESAVLNNIAMIYEKFKLNEQAFEYYQKALDIDHQRKDSIGIAYTLLNLGYLKQQMNQLNKVDQFYKQALKIALRFQLTEIVAAVMHNYGNLYRMRRQYQTAEVYYERAVKLADSIKNYYGLSSSLLEWARLKRMLNSRTEAIDLLERAKCLTLQHTISDKRAEALRMLAELAAEQSDFRSAHYYWNAFVSLSDSLRELDNRRTTQELMFKFDARQKKRIIDELQQINRLQQQTLEQEQRIRFLLSVGGVILLIFFVLLFLQFRQKRRANRVLNIQRQQLEAQARDLIAAHAEALAYSQALEQTNQSIQKQHEIIEQQHRSLVDSLEYAYRIQQAMLPDFNNFRQVFPDSFVLYRPKAIVSGDFYWLHVSPERIMLAVADCTGHGVPGAFMAILGKSLLNQIILQEGSESPQEILTILDRRVQEHLHHERSRSTGPSADGMELALCRIDYKLHQLTFAGANRPLYQVRNDQLHELRGSKAVISGHIGARREDFCEHTINLSPGDNIYLFSDGYVDQLGEVQGKRRKFSSTRFKRLLINVSNLPMNSQKIELRRAINRWRGRFPFIDDVLIIGFRYPHSL